MEDRIIARLRKSEIEEIVIALRTYQGNEFVDFRIFFGARGQETRPTKKGITIHLELYSEFRRSIELLDGEMAKEGWS